MTPRSVVVTVAVGLVAGMIIGIVGIIALSLLGKSPPDILSNITVGLVGACAGLLARTGTDEPPANPAGTSTVRLSATVNEHEPEA